MMREFDVAFHIPGTLVAMNIRWNVPDDCTLLHVSGHTTNDSNTTITIGDEDTAELHLVESDVGMGGNTVYEFGHQAFSDFVGGQWPRILDGDTIVIIVNPDGDSGTTGNDLTLVLRFAEG